MNSFSLSERRPNPGKGSSAAGISILTAVRRLAVLSIVYETWKNGFGVLGEKGREIRPKAKLCTKVPGNGGRNEKVLKQQSSSALEKCI